MALCVVFPSSVEFSYLPADFFLFLFVASGDGVQHVPSFAIEIAGEGGLHFFQFFEH